MGNYSKLPLVSPAFNYLSVNEHVTVQSPLTKREFPWITQLPVIAILDVSTLKGSATFSAKNCILSIGTLAFVSTGIVTTGLFGIRL